MARPYAYKGGFSHTVMLECFPADTPSEFLARFMAAPHIGVDEAGRGCLAGPVVAGAVFFPPYLIPEKVFPGLTDSKKLSAGGREKLYPLIRTHTLWALGLSWPQEIDRINILNATFRAMSRAVERLHTLRGISPLPRLLIDGNHPIRPDAWKCAWESHVTPNIPLPPQFPVIKGDSLVLAISAASVLAKVFRDRLMLTLEHRYPGYGFAKHKGYGTAEHCEAIHQKGFSPMHRKTFQAGKRSVRNSMF